MIQVNGVTVRRWGKRITGGLVALASVGALVLAQSTSATASVAATRSAGCAAINGASGTGTSFSSTGTFKVGEVVEFVLAAADPDDVGVLAARVSAEKTGGRRARTTFVPWTYSFTVDEDDEWTFGVTSKEWPDFDGPILDTDKELTYSVTCQLSQTISANLPSVVSVGTTPFSFSASSGVPVSVQSDSPSCSVSSTALTATAPGPCAITLATINDPLWYPVVRVLNVQVKAPQTITFPEPSDVAYGTAPFGLSATASSGLTVSFATTTPSVCSVSGTTVTVGVVGTCTITASQAGDSSYFAATDVTRSFEVSKASQTITFGSLSDRTMLATPFSVSATASSGLAVTFASTTSAVCSATSAGEVSLVSPGTCTIRASQAGNANYQAADDVSRSFTVSKASQTITFGSLSDRSMLATPFSVSATASSGLAVTFASTTSSVCTATAAGEVSLVSPGTCTIRASQAGNANYEAAADVSRSFTVSKASQTITFGSLASKPLGTTGVTVSASASSGLPVTFSSSTPTVCTVSGSSVTLVAVGTCTVVASQPGNAQYAAAADVSQSFTVGYVISRLAPPAKTTVKRGSNIPVKFQLSTANGTPISPTAAAAIRCPSTSPTAPSATVTLAGLAPVCATYDAASGFFQANVKTTNVAAGDQPLTVTVRAGSTVLATTTVIVKIVR